MDEPIESTPPTSDDEASGSGSDSGWVSLEDKTETVTYSFYMIEYQRSHNYAERQTISTVMSE
jgi:hypothetical protein